MHSTDVMFTEWSRGEQENKALLGRNFSFSGIGWTFSFKAELTFDKRQHVVFKFDFSPRNNWTLEQGNVS